MIPQAQVEDILSILPEYNPSHFLASEITALQTVVGEILKEIQDRKDLEGKLLDSLSAQQRNVNSELMNIRPGYTLQSFDRMSRLQSRLDAMQIQKTETQREMARDITELKKALWHYWILLERKKTQSQMIN